VTASETKRELGRTLGTLLAVTLVSLSAVLWLRYGVMESGTLALRCAADAPAWWCGGRSALGLLIHYQVFGWTALLFGVLAWTVKTRTLAWVALVAALGGLVLYNTSLAVVGLVAALLRAVRD